MKFDQVHSELCTVEGNPGRLHTILTEHPFAPSKLELEDSPGGFALIFATIVSAARGCKISRHRAPMALDLTEARLEQMANGELVPLPYKMVEIVAWIKKEAEYLAKLQAA